jgi:hypothetical protein
LILLIFTNELIENVKEFFKMPKDWQELTKLTRGAPISIERVRIVDSGIKIEGDFDLPTLARLSAEDQVFVMAFIRCDGSIKEMERVFGISYPTVKNRLTRIAGQFEFVENMPMPVQEDVLDKLARGEITVNDAIERLQK